MGKSFGFSVLASFLVVFGGFYLVSLRGEADQDSFKPISSKDLPVDSSATVSLLNEPKVQENADKTVVAEAKPKKETKSAEKRAPASTEDEMKVVLKKSATVASNEVAPTKGLEEKDLGLKKTETSKLEAMMGSKSAGTKVGNGKKFAVQIASNTKKDKSELVLQDLEKKGFKGFIEEADVNGTTYYRVKMGPVDSRDEAEALKMSLGSKAGVSDSLITNQ